MSDNLKRQMALHFIMSWGLNSLQMHTETKLEYTYSTDKFLTSAHINMHINILFSWLPQKKN